MWNSWCEQLAQRMNAETDRELSEEVRNKMMVVVMTRMVMIDKDAVEIPVNDETRSTGWWVTTLRSVKSGWGCWRRRPTPIFGTRSKEANVSNLCVECESDLTLPGGGDAGRARLLPMGSNRGGVDPICPSSYRLPLPYSTDNSMTKAKEHSKEMCFLSPKSFDQQAHLSYPALSQHADPQANPISLPHLSRKCRWWRKRGRTPRRTCRSKRPATWEPFLSGLYVNIIK